jgi:hypothetical protein
LLIRYAGPLSGAVDGAVADDDACRSTRIPRRRPRSETNRHALVGAISHPGSIHYTAGLRSPSVPPTGPLMGELGHQRGRVWFHRARGKDEVGLGKLQLVARYFGKAGAVEAKTGAFRPRGMERGAPLQREARGKLKPLRDVVLAICEHHFMMVTR